MVLTELYPDGESALGPFTGGLLVLTRDAHRHMGHWFTHRLDYADKLLARRILLGRARSERCRSTGHWFLTFLLGVLPVTLEATPEDRVRVRVGYRSKRETP